MKTNIQNQITEETVKPKPEILAKFRSGGVSATIFQNIKEINGKNISIPSVKVTKSYTKDEGKTWNDTNNYSREELVKLREVTQKAIEFLYLNEE